LLLFPKAYPELPVLITLAKAGVNATFPEKRGAGKRKLFVKSIFWLKPLIRRPLEDTFIGFCLASLMKWR